MNPLLLECPAKVNLFLELHGKRQDGFHEIATVMTPISLSDVLRVQPARRFTLRVQGRKLTGTNTVEKAYRLIQKQRKIPPLQIELQKNIPAGAGLGGGSSNAAALIMAVDQMFHLELDKHAIAKEVGSDVPFFLQRSPALCTGRGEVIHPLPATRNLSLTLFFPPVEALTKEVYRQAQEEPGRNRKDEADFLRTYLSGTIPEIKRKIFNRLESPALNRYALLREWKRKLGPGTHLTGSGSTFFQIHNSPEKARKIAHEKGGVAISTLSPFPPLT